MRNRKYPIKIINQLRNEQKVEWVRKWKDNLLVYMH